jgi:hypothetical protein
MILKRYRYRPVTATAYQDSPSATVTHRPSPFLNVHLRYFKKFRFYNSGEWANIDLAKRFYNLAFKKFTSIFETFNLLECGHEHYNSEFSMYGTYRAHCQGLRTLGL